MSEKATAKNTPFLAAAKKAFNASIYKLALDAYQEGGERAARKALGAYTSAPEFAPRSKAIVLQEAPPLPLTEDGLAYAVGGQHPAMLPSGASCLCPSHTAMVLDLGELRREFKGNKAALARIRTEQQVRDGLIDRPKRQRAAQTDAAPEQTEAAPKASGTPREAKPLTLPLTVEASVFFDGRMDRSKTPGPVLQALGVRGGDRLVYHIAEDGTVTVTAKRAEQTADAEAA